MTTAKAPAVIVADFETKRILPRPQYPPKPVSLALKWPGGEYLLMAWGHGDGTKTMGNNCTEKEARGQYLKARDSKFPMLFQNAMFDTDVANVHWDIPLPPWELYHDTMFLLALYDPHATSLGLKQSAERLLGIKPEEQDRMYEWIIANVPAARQKPSEVGGYISECPYQIVRTYHKGDLVRTEKLFQWLWPRVTNVGMGDAYVRERRLMPILLRNARRGMRVDVPALERDLPLMKAGLEKADGWLHRRLGDINLDSPQQLAAALRSTGAVTDFKLTRKGKPSVSKNSLTIDCFKDPRVYHALTYHGQMETSVNMFVQPWLELSRQDGLLHADWSQVRTDKVTGGQKGARSLRIICSKPNLLNIPKKWKKAVVAGYLHPAFVGKLPPLPFMRTYVLPSKGKRWGRRDYNQQEVRLFGHFEEGPVMEGFLHDPAFDMHENVRIEEEAALIASGLRDAFDRDSAKGTVFGAFYGQGLTGLMMLLKLRDPEDRAVGQTIHRALHHAVPSIRDLSKALEAEADKGLPIRTIGGRLYYCEEPQYSEKYGRDMTFGYKLISYLIQGSGADVTKQAIVLYDEHPMRTEDLNVTVYDEIDVDLPMSDRGARHEMTILCDCMLAAAKCDVPLLSDGEIGPNWGTLEKFVI
jgi:DNA polymerase I-like protein with 3'-5' exonuclease and polymerase domains